MPSREIGAVLIRSTEGASGLASASNGRQPEKKRFAPLAHPTADSALILAISR